MLITQKNKIRHLSKSDYIILGNLCHIAKNYYNSTLYEINKYAILIKILRGMGLPEYSKKLGKTEKPLKNGWYLNSFSSYHLLKTNENYKLLMSEYESQIRKIADENWKSYFATIKQWKKSHDGYLGMPESPHYLPRNGKFVIKIQKRSIRIAGNYIMLSLSKGFKEKYLLDKLTEVKIPKPNFITKKNIQELRIVPNHNCFIVEFVYNKDQQIHELIPNTYLSVDLGIDNLATCVDCQSGRSFIVDGRKLKSYNRWYNKQRAELQSIKDLQKIKGMTKQLHALEERRMNYIWTYMHRSVSILVKYTIEHNISNILVGENKGWKQEVNLGKRTNQKFVSIPFDNFKRKLNSKCEQHGINYLTETEEYTSGCSFLDGESINLINYNKTRRIHRGLFRSNSGKYLNADVNAAANIYVKHTGNCLFGAGSGILSMPIRLIV